MNFKQHDNNQFTKERDKIERYLMRIIHRYFDIENNYTKESIEAIIIESLSRLKHFMGTSFNFIITFNDKTGSVLLSLKDLHGEPAFDKNNAFNKDFGNVSGTICEGNDSRLEDERTPLPHTHVELDITGLKELIEQCNTLDGLHSHDNKSILDMFSYTGTKTKIDLAMIEYLNDVVLEYKSTIAFRNSEVETIYNQSMNHIIKFIDDITHGLNDARLSVQNSTNWIDKAYTYIDDKIKQLKDDTNKKLAKFVLKDSADKVKRTLSNALKMASINEFGLNASGITTHSTNVTINTNDKIKLFIKYDYNGNTVTTPLPLVFTEDGILSVVQGGYTSNGQIVITESINRISNYVTNPKIYYQIIKTEV